MKATEALKISTDAKSIEGTKYLIFKKILKVAKTGSTWIDIPHWMLGDNFSEVIEELKDYGYNVETTKDDVRIEW